jgi:putative aldouronate transport system permease protein
MTQVGASAKEMPGVGGRVTARSAGTAPVRVSARTMRHRSQRRVRESPGDRVLLSTIYIGLGLVAVVILFPLLYIVAASFSSVSAVIENKVLIVPVHPTLAGYLGVIDFPGFWLSYGNALLYTVAGTLVSVTLSVLFGWPLSRPQLYGRRLFTSLLVFAFIFNGGLIPFYLVVKDLHMLNTRLAMIFPGALSIFSVILARSFFKTTIPEELVQAARVDGCSEFGILWRVVVPISKPVLAVLALIFAVGVWNSYFYALIFLNSPSLYPLQLVLREVLEKGQLTPAQISSLSPSQLQHFESFEQLVKYSIIVISSLPMLIFYPVIQKYFVKGLRIGSLKE